MRKVLLLKEAVVRSMWYILWEEADTHSYLLEVCEVCEVTEESVSVRDKPVLRENMMIVDDAPQPRLPSLH